MHLIGLKCLVLIAEMPCSTMIILFRFEQQLVCVLCDFTGQDKRGTKLLSKPCDKREKNSKICIYASILFFYVNGTQMGCNALQESFVMAAPKIEQVKIYIAEKT